MGCIYDLCVIVNVTDKIHFFTHTAVGPLFAEIYAQCLRMFDVLLVILYGFNDLDCIFIIQLLCTEVKFVFLQHWHDVLPMITYQTQACVINGVENAVIVMVPNNVVFL